MAHYSMEKKRLPPFQMKYFAAFALILSVQAYAMNANVAKCETFARLSRRSSPDIALTQNQQLTSVRTDRLLGSTWALVVNCDHPEWPVHMIPFSNRVASEALDLRAIDRGAAALSSQSPIVRAGEKVTLWKRDDAVFIEMIGTAEEAGRLGQRIRVRVLQHAMQSEGLDRQVFGVIRGAGLVEFAQ